MEKDALALGVKAEHNALGVKAEHNALGVKAEHNAPRLTTDEVIADYHAFCEQQRVEKAARVLETQRATQRAAEARRFAMETTDWYALAAEQELGHFLAPGGGMRIEKNVHVSNLFTGLPGAGNYNLLIQVREDGTEQVVCASAVPKDGSEQPNLDAFLRVDRKRRAPDDNTRE